MPCDVIGEQVETGRLCAEERAPSGLAGVTLAVGDGEETSSIAFMLPSEEMGIDDDGGNDIL